MQFELARSFDLGADFSVQLINVSENKIFRIDCSDGRRFALRLARPGYHTADELASEVAWLEALREQSAVNVARPIKGRDGKYLQQILGQNALLFEWVDGQEPQITDNLLVLAEQLGTIAAHLHNHAQNWQRPTNFTRPRWVFAAALGTEMRWGDWRKGLGVQHHMLPLLSKTVAEIERQLKDYGESEQRFNLIHGDLRLANLLINQNKLTVIDFDDCGFGWLMYDGATMLSFHEHEPQAASMIGKWIEGYGKLRNVTVQDEAAIHTLIMFRRILLLAWLGSHSEIDLAREVKSVFADQTLFLCERFLTRGTVF